MVREPIPDWRGWTKSQAGDSGPLPDHIAELVTSTRAEDHRRKKKYTRWIRRGVLADQSIAAYSFGPFDLPVDIFTSSRWHERRTKIPLPVDEDGWRTCWEFWRGATSYRGIKSHIEEHGMRRPILAEWFVNYDPADNQLVHRAFAFRGENPRWPYLILRTGNERLMMAWFDWGWRTIPTVVIVRDCGHDQLVSGLLRWTAGEAVSRGLVGSRGICRRIDEKG